MIESDLNQASKWFLDNALIHKFVTIHNDLATLRILSDAILYALGVNVIVLSGLRFTNWEVEIWVHAASISGGALLGSFMAARTNRPTLSNVLVWFGLVIACFVLAGSLWDTSWDGTGYHLPSVIFLAEHQNPITGTWAFEDARLYVHYPHGVYLWQWSIAALSGSFQIAKVTHALLLFIALARVIELLVVLKGKRLDFLDIAFCYAIVLNPIVTGQFFTFYLDSPLYLVSLILLGQLVSNGNINTIKNSLGLFFSVVLLVNMKLTGIYFAGSLIALYLLIALAKQQPVKRTAVVCLFAGIFGVGFVGYYPYVTETLKAGTPFFVPVEEIMALQRPRNLESLPPPAKLAYSVFSSTDFRMGRLARLKIPISIGKREIISMGVPGARIGGFGPLFALELLVFFALVPRLIYRRRVIGEAASYLAILACGVLVVSAAFPEPWAARYVPVFWVVPLFIGLAYRLSGAVSKAGSYVVILGLLLASFNSGLALLGNAARTMKGNLELLEVAQRAQDNNNQLTISKAVGPLFHVSLPIMLDSDGLMVTTRPDQSCDVRIYNFHRSWICYSHENQKRK